MENTYSINQVEVLSGIKSHTLRIWEKRYAIIEPKRTDTNIRYFTKEDLKKILNISYLNKLGVKISKLAELDDEEISNQVLSNYESSKNVNQLVQLFSVDVFNYDLQAFKAKTEDYLKINSFNSFLKEIIYPLFDRIGIMWQTNLIIPAQEHLFSNYIRQIICSEINNIKQKPNKEKVLLFLRENEYHELGLLIYQYILANKGYDVFYLGQSVPFEDLSSVIKQIKPKIIITSFLAYLEADSFNLYMDKLNTITEGTPIYLSGNTSFIKEHKKHHKYDVINDLNEFIKFF